MNLAKKCEDKRKVDIRLWNSESTEKLRTQKKKKMNMKMVIKIKIKIKKSKMEGGEKWEVTKQGQVKANKCASLD